MAKPPARLADWQALAGALPGDCLRIASYNVHACVGTDGRKDAARVVGVIEELGCDTVGLQEVDYRLDFIAHRLGMEAVPGLTLLRHDGPYGNALVTRRTASTLRRVSSALPKGPSWRWSVRPGIACMPSFCAMYSSR